MDNEATKVCEGCQLIILDTLHSESVIVDDKIYHSGCFVCGKCQVRLNPEEKDKLVYSDGRYTCSQHKISVTQKENSEKSPTKSQNVKKMSFLKGGLSKPMIEVPASPKFRGSSIPDQQQSPSSPDNSLDSHVNNSANNAKTEDYKPSPLNSDIKQHSKSASSMLFSGDSSKMPVEIEENLSPIKSPEKLTDFKYAEEQKMEVLLASYQQVKVCSVKVLKCCEKLKGISQDGRIGLLQDFVSQFRLTRDFLRRFIDSTTVLSSMADLRRNGVDMLKFEILMTTEFLLGNGISQNVEDFRKLIQIMNVNIDGVMRKFQPANKMMIKTLNGFKEESCFDNTFEIPEEINYQNSVLEHVIDCTFFRKTFVGRAYDTYVGIVETYGPVIISLKKEDVENGDILYTILFRVKNGAQGDRVATFLSSQVKRSFLSRKPSPKQVIQLLDLHVNFSKLKLVIPDPQFETRLLALDEFKYRPKYKFGVLLAKPGQTTDDEFLSNQSGSVSYERFLTALGVLVKLKDFNGFSGGLDVKNGKTGETTIYSRWKNFEVVYHCSTLLPFKVGDLQQIDRKRHIGNDIINIIYLDGDMQFDPSSIKTQFTHVYIVVKHEIVIGPDEKRQNGFRVAITRSIDVPKFGPPLPNPPVFTDLKQLHNFLLAKLVNGENAALKAPKFSKPNIRAFEQMFDNLIDDYSKGRRANDGDSTSPMARMIHKKFSLGIPKRKAKLITYSMTDVSKIEDSHDFPKVSGMHSSPQLASKQSSHLHMNENQSFSVTDQNLPTYHESGPIAQP